ncbi:MAG: hypothetical protein SD837_02570 [Candidatus Electrothrix scaldis]|nr:MAG: hypothetical protein SD837_02570 [Candidatus Electrothrix sp. GW3-3]
MVGRQFKRGFDMLFRKMKCTVYVHKKYGTNEQTTAEYQALKNNEKNRPSKVMFQFPERIDIDVGDMIQQKSANDLWEVYETEDTVIGDVFIHFEAKVNKAGAAKPFQHGGNVIIQGSNYGAIQSHSPQSTQNVVVNNTNISYPIGELRKLLDTDAIDELDREECHAALSRIEELATRPTDPRITERIKQKLDIVNGTFAVAKNVADFAAPYVGVIAAAFGLK